MTRETLADLMDDLDDGQLFVDVGGTTVQDGRGESHDIDHIKDALDRGEADIALMRSVIAWAKQAPKYTGEK